MSYEDTIMMVLSGIVVVPLTLIGIAVGVGIARTIWDLSQKENQ